MAGDFVCFHQRAMIAQLIRKLKTLRGGGREELERS